jgi:hypothetical protein
MGEATKPRLLIRVAAIAFVSAMLFVVAEVGASLLLVYRDRLNGHDCDLLSSVVVFRRAAAKLGWTDYGSAQFDIESPGLTLVDDVFGWSLVPGEHTVVFKHRGCRDIEWERFPTKMTFNGDQSRWTGLQFDPSKPTIYIFGDSFVEGWGVNDEQTFAYYLQMALQRYNVKLFAAAGYSLVHTYLRFQQLKSNIRPDDIVIIGYADFYDGRNVAAPSGLRELETWMKTRVAEEKNRKLGKIPKAEIGKDGRLTISLVERDCHTVVDYCKKTDPSQSYMTMVSVRLINEIARETEAKVYLLHFDGLKTNAIFQNLDHNVTTISALQEDFGFFIRDTIEYFDPHPGPYWHYAISRKLLSQIQ